MDKKLNYNETDPKMIEKETDNEQKSSQKQTKVQIFILDIEKNWTKTE